MADNACVITADWIAPAFLASSFSIASELDRSVHARVKWRRRLTRRQAFLTAKTPVIGSCAATGS
jgi:hypothetical protein